MPFTVTGHHPDGQHLALPCPTYLGAMAAYQHARSQGYRDLQITQQTNYPHNTEESWTDLVDTTITELFPTDVGERIQAAEAFGALTYRLHQRAQLYGQTPSEVLRELSEDDLYFTAHAEEPAAFLAAKVRDLPDPTK